MGHRRHEWNKTLAGTAAAAAAGAPSSPEVPAAADSDLGRDGREAAARLPGDELLEEADGVATRAITIEAPRSAVWPWIAQMGPSPRGGAYTYDWIENLLGLNMHSADRVLPEYQHPQIGDGFGYGTNKMSFKIVEPEHVLATQSADGNWVWTFLLEEQDGSTQLLSRNRFRLPKLKDKIGMIPMEPGSLVMERKMLRSSSAPSGSPPRRRSRPMSSRGTSSRRRRRVGLARRSGSTGRARRSTSTSSESG